MYADIGPMSFQKRQKAVIDTYKLDDDRVQYVQVKPQTRKEEVESVSKDQHHPAGIDLCMINSDVYTII